MKSVDITKPLPRREPEQPVLTLRDRCDATASEVEAAVVLVVLEPGQEPLLFCEHHWRQHRKAILSLDPSLVIDSRDDESDW
jgi:hypothetical protein